ncbi:hypothetical protein N752_24615 [Desulforamulus aquiferis]|nr:hypothetical protein [Desulforamulus aquiferis]RYD02515.1 hypothetical protein N752_24615 [Desulforamulus aquiferis]
MMKGIETNSRLKVTGLVSNTNLGRQTDVETMVQGYAKVSEIASKLGLPVAFMAAPKPLVPEVMARLPEVSVLPLEFFMKTPWEEAFGEAY